MSNSFLVNQLINYPNVPVKYRLPSHSFEIVCIFLKYVSPECANQWRKSSCVVWGRYTLGRLRPQYCNCNLEECHLDSCVSYVWGLSDVPTLLAISRGTAREPVVIVTLIPQLPRFRDGMSIHSCTLCRILKITFDFKLTKFIGVVLIEQYICLHKGHQSILLYQWGPMYTGALHYVVAHRSALHFCSNL